MKIRKILVLEHCGKIAILEAGTDDDISVHRQKTRVLIESRNGGLGYSGLQVVDLRTMETLGSAFDDSSDETDLETLLEIAGV